MKSLAAAIALFYFASTMAAAPYGIKGQKQAATLYSNVHQFPNNQVTNMGGIDALVETGNKNILENPSFEHLTVSSGWTDSGTDTGIATAVAVIDGKKALGFLPVARSVNLTQSSTLYASQFADGVQGLAMVRIKSDVAVKVCSIQAGTVSTTNCVTTNTDLKWGLYKVPFILGGTSNGISISTNGTLVTGTVIVDDAFVGAVDLKQDFAAANTQSSILDQTATFGAVAITGALTVSSGSGVYSYNSGTGVYTLLKNATVTVTNAQSAGTATAIIPMLFVNGVLRTLCHSPSAINQWCEASYTGKHLAGEYFTVTNGQATSNNQRISFMATENVATSVYSTPNITNADRIGEIIQTTNSTAPNGFISAMNVSIGQAGSGANFTGNSYYALYEHLWGLAGLTTTAGDVYRISSAKGATALADFAANKTITVDYQTNAPFIRGKAAAASIGSYTNSAVPNITGAAGTIMGSFTASGAFTTSAPLTALYGGGGGNGRTLNIDASLSSSVYQAVTEAKPKNVSLFMYIRYTGDSNIIIGSFDGLQSCTSTLACTDTFSAKVSSAGIVTSENVEWITGNCTVSATSTYTCTMSPFTVAPNCEVTANGGSNMNLFFNAATTATTVVPRSQNNLNVDTAQGFDIICQKQGADYVGKTAMAVASDQNLRTPGVTKGVVYSGVVSATGVVSNEQGDLINGTCSNAGNIFTCTLNSGAILSGGNCVVSSFASTGARTAVVNTFSSSQLIVYTWINGATASAGDFSYFCNGVSP